MTEGHPYATDDRGEKKKGRITSDGVPVQSGLLNEGWADGDTYSPKPKRRSTDGGD